MEHNDKSNGRKGSTAVAFLIGAVAGGVTALLFAPKTGVEMRSRIKSGARNLQNRGKTVKGAVSEARDTYRRELDKRRPPSGTAMVRPDESEVAGSKSPL